MKEVIKTKYIFEKGKIIKENFYKINGKIYKEKINVFNLKNFITGLIILSIIGGGIFFFLNNNKTKIPTSSPKVSIKQDVTTENISKKYNEVEIKNYILQNYGIVKEGNFNNLFEINVIDSKLEEFIISEYGGNNKFLVNDFYNQAGTGSDFGKFISPEITSSGQIIFLKIKDYNLIPDNLREQNDLFLTNGIILYIEKDKQGGVAKTMDVTKIMKNKFEEVLKEFKIKHKRYFSTKEKVTFFQEIDNMKKISENENVINFIYLKIYTEILKMETLSK